MDSEPPKTHVRVAVLAVLTALAGGCGWQGSGQEAPAKQIVEARGDEDGSDSGEQRGRPVGRTRASESQARVADPWKPGRGQFAIARVRPGRSVKLRSTPGGRPVELARSRTGFGSVRFLGVAAREGSWLGLVSAERPNGRLGWVEARSPALAPYRTDVSLRADLSRREVELRKGGRVVRRFKVGVGRPGYPTPTGRFAVTDKLSGSSFGGTYGCCILALSGHQVKLPPGWPGGDRLALHGTRDQRSIGNAASTGCLRGRDADLRALLRRVPLGAPMFIRR